MTHSQRGIAPAAGGGARSAWSKILHSLQRSPEAIGAVVDVNRRPYDISPCAESFSRANLFGESADARP
jgi:hypothetical protein